MGSSDDEGIPVRCLPSVNRVSPYADTALDPGLNEDSAAVEEYNIDQRDLRQIYLSPHAYDHAFEEEPGDAGGAEPGDVAEEPGEAAGGA